MERLFGLTYVEVRAFLCALNSIYNITELMSGDFVLGVDQALSKSLTWFEVDLYFVFLENSSELLIDLLRMGLDEGPLGDLGNSFLPLTMSKQKREHDLRVAPIRLSGTTSKYSKYLHFPRS